MLDIEQQLSQQLSQIMGIDVLSYVSDDDAFERITDSGKGLVMYSSSVVKQEGSSASSLLKTTYRQIAIDVILVAPKANVLSDLIERVYQSIDVVQLTGYRKLEIVADRLDGVFQGLHNGSVSLTAIKA